MPVSLSRSTLFNTILKTPAAPPCTQTRYEHATIFWLRAMASDLEVLILILTRSHQCELDVTAWWSQQDHIIRKKLRQGLGLCLCNLLCLKFSLINRISGEKSSPGGVQLPQEWGWLTAGNANQALTAVIQKLDCPKQQTNNNNIQSPSQEESWLLPGSHHLPPFNVEEQQLYFKHLLNDWTFFL